MLRDIVLDTILSTNLKIDEIYSRKLRTIKNDQLFISFGSSFDTSQLDVFVRRFEGDHTVKIFHYSRSEFWEIIEGDYNVHTYV